LRVSTSKSKRTCSAKSSSEIGKPLAVLVCLVASEARPSHAKRRIRALDGSAPSVASSKRRAGKALDESHER
jgi:hypothetical protein